MLVLKKDPNSEYQSTKQQAVKVEHPNKEQPGCMLPE